jgi:hypothetical protein
MRSEPHYRGKRAGRVKLPQRYHQLLEEMKNKGYDVSEAMKLDERAKSEMRQGNRQEARRLLREAIATLEALETGTSHRPLSSEDKYTGKTRVVELPVSSPKIYVTEAVPSPESGKEIEKHHGAFETRTVAAQGGKLSIELTGTPVIIEEQVKIDRERSSRSKDSPFGITFTGFLKDLDAIGYVDDLGASWIRFLGRAGLVWHLVEQEKGSYTWSRTDELFSIAHRHGLSILVNLYAINPWDQPEIKETRHPRSNMRRRPARYPSDMDSYLRFVRKCVERYNGDGINDAPGSPTIKGWIIGCEMENPLRWADTPENYAKLFVKTYQIIKKHDPEATVLMYGSNFELNRQKGTIDAFTKPVLNEVRKLSKDVPDLSFVYSLHHYKADPAKLTDNITKTRKMLDSLGFRKIPIWMTDSATFTSGSSGKRFRCERKLAGDVIKLYSVGLANGIEKYVWAQLSDGYRGRNSIEGGFIGRHGRHSKTTYKKLAYYTYKLMTEKLGNSNWVAVKILHEGKNGTYVYAFEDKHGNKTYVAWADFHDTR